MLCPNCKKAIENNAAYCDYCGCDIENTIYKNKEKRRNKYIFLGTICAAFIIVFGFFISGAFINSEAFLRYQFKNALESHNYEKAISLTNAEYSKYVTPEKVKDLCSNIDLMPVLPTGEKNLFIFNEKKIDLNSYIKEPVFYFYKGTKVYFNEDELQGKEYLGGHDCHIYKAPKVLTGTYKLEVISPMCEKFKDDNFKINRDTKDFNENIALVLNKDETEKLKKAALDEIKTIYEGIAQGKKFEELNLPNHISEYEENEKEKSFNILLNLFFDGSPEHKFATENFKIESLETDDEAVSLFDGKFRINVNMVYSFTLVEKGENKDNRFKNDRTITVDLKKFNGNWEISSFLVPANW